MIMKSKKGEMMQKTDIQLTEIKLVGIKCRTNNQAEQNSKTAKIGLLVQNYFQNTIAAKIANRLAPSTTYSLYTEYDSDYQGGYTYFIGEAVASFVDIPEDLFTIIVPAQNYIKFTNGPGIMPDVCINVWQKIWQMTPNELGGTRAYKADFEIYDSRAADPSKVVLDVCVGIMV